MKKTYLAPSLQELIIRTESLLLNESPTVGMSGNSATTTNGEYNTLSRENNSSFDDED